MASVNSVTLIGLLGRDLEVRASQSGIITANLSVATDESYKNKSGEWVKQTEWHKVVCFNSLAENCQRYLHKGSQVYVEGSLRTRKWQDRDGNERYTTEINARRIQFLDRRQETEEEREPERKQARSYDDAYDDVPF